MKTVINAPYGGTQSAHVDQMQLYRVYACGIAGCKDRWDSCTLLYNSCNKSPIEAYGAL